MNTIKNWGEFTNEKKSFWDTEGDDFLTSCNKKNDLRARQLKPEAGDWVNLRKEWGDVWHRIINVFNSEDSYGAFTYYDLVDSKSNDVKKNYTFFYNISDVQKTLPDNARCIYDETGAYSEKRGNLSQFKMNEDAGGDAGSSGVSCSTLGNVSGMGDVVASQPSVIPGDVWGSTTGSGDIGQPLGVYIKEPYGNETRKNKKKRKNKYVMPISDFMTKLYSDIQK